MKTPNYPEGRRLLQGKNVVITAAAGAGIGFAAAKRCVEEGARVFISDIHEARLGKAASRLSELCGAEVPSRLCDVRLESDVSALFSSAIDAMGHVDVLINNAGLGGTVDLVDMTDEQWNTVLDVSLTGTMRCTRAAMRHMLQPLFKGGHTPKQQTVPMISVQNCLGRAHTTFKFFEVEVSMSDFMCVLELCRSGSPRTC